MASLSGGPFTNTGKRRKLQYEKAINALAEWFGGAPLSFLMAGGKDGGTRYGLPVQKRYLFLQSLHKGVIDCE